MGKVESHIIKKKMLKSTALSKGFIQCIEVDKFVDEISKILSKNKYWLVD